MPYEKLDIETDGNEETMYEDTEAHERTGFAIDEEDRLPASQETREELGLD
ncbi:MULTISPECIES: hypothetical protein [Paenibacillus]|uniref:hypothetical protein n=1 Tax=Paenibacillus TaxID=44249 RepID=UPI0022B89031|nr:hypothetical protein [Paenibacillus caseinilyticus]MCZ8521975.1 hypothetical protein [Paenibacillus caseinilyticus]